MILLARLAPRTCSPSDRASFFFFLPAAPRTKSLRPGFCQGSRDRRIRPVKVEFGRKGRARDEHSWRIDRHKSQITSHGPLFTGLPGVILLRRFELNFITDRLNLPPLPLSAADQVANEKTLQDWNQRHR